MNENDISLTLQSVAHMVRHWRRLAASNPDYHRFNEADFALMHNLANNTYEQGKYADAARFFSALAFCRPLDEQYLFGWAASLQMMERFDDAVTLYGLLALLNPDNLLPGLHMAECLMRKGDTPAAKQVLEALLPNCDDRPDRIGLADKIQAYLGLIEASHA